MSGYARKPLPLGINLSPGSYTNLSNFTIYDEAGLGGIWRWLEREGLDKYPVSIDLRNREILVDVPANRFQGEPHPARGRRMHPPAGWTVKLRKWTVL